MSNNNNNNNFPIGTHVSFDYDSLKSTGIIISYSTSSTVIVVLNNQNTGWEISERETSSEEHIGKMGWSVPVSYLKHTKTKLGNVL